MKRSIHVLRIAHSKNPEILSNILASKVNLYIETRKLQWHVLYDEFPCLHKLFQSLYFGIEETIDLLYGDINKLGGKAINDIQEGTKLSRHNRLHNNCSQKDVIAELLTEQEAIVSEINNQIETIKPHEASGSNDFLVEIIAQCKTTNSTLRNIGMAIFDSNSRQNIY